VVVGTPAATVVTTAGVELPVVKPNPNYYIAPTPLPDSIGAGADGGNEDGGPGAAAPMHVAVPMSTPQRVRLPSQSPPPEDLVMGTPAGFALATIPEGEPSHK
jgi:hypothetical protein